MILNKVWQHIVIICIYIFPFKYKLQDENKSSQNTEAWDHKMQEFNSVLVLGSCSIFCMSHRMHFVSYLHILIFIFLTFGYFRINAIDILKSEFGSEGYNIQLTRYLEFDGTMEKI